MAEIMRIARKEFRVFFASPAAWLFLGAFLVVTLFVFFWVETFFARNLADLQPLFQWMPVLLIFLVAALTMRSWSEERRSGTLESLLTAPVRPLHLVLGKFLAALALVALALALTLPLPITISLLGPLDWGPVIGGYVASLFLAAAYIAIGLYTSSRTDNPVVALILTAVVGGILYGVGMDALTNLFGRDIGNVLAQLGTGTHFESITRGVLDLRDLYYYLSIVAVFLTLNLHQLERLRWWGNPGSRQHRLHGWVAALVVVNVIAANFWLAPLHQVRADMTANNIYSLSDATREQLGQLREPLVIKGYFSDKTHPLLAPLVPRVKDLLKEYAVTAGERARVEFIDPTRNQEAAESAAAQYSVKPVPLQTDSRYQSSVVNAYFNVVVAYGDEHQTLNFRDLIQIKRSRGQDVQVNLKNPEYQITRAVRKTINTYQAAGNPFATLDQPVTFKGYMSPREQLPDKLKSLRSELRTVLEELKQQSDGQFDTEFADPGANDQLAQRLEREFGFGPQVASLLNPQEFWFYMVLESGDDTLQVALPESPDKEALKQAVRDGLQRLTSDYLKTIALVKPQQNARNPMARRMRGSRGHSWSRLKKKLREGARIQETDLSSGQAPSEADILLVLAPDELDEKQRFAIDQFLMRGGSVVMATSPFDVKLQRGLSASRHSSGLKKWLEHHGLNVRDSLVLDPENAELPLPDRRQVGGVSVRKVRMAPYPYFPDVRDSGLNQQHPVTSSLSQLTLNWASPIRVNSDKNDDLDVSKLVQSSSGSWTSDELQMMPDAERYPDHGFPAGDKRQSRTLAVAVEGRFESAFKGQQSPLLDKKNDNSEASSGSPPGSGGMSGEGKGQSGKNEPSSSPITGVIEHSPKSARLVLVGSNTFASDMALKLTSRGMETRYTRPLAFIQNAVGWSLGNPGLLELRGQTRLTRTLNPLSSGEQRFWEYLNYGLALAGLLLVWIWRRRVAVLDRRRYQRILGEV